MSIPEINLEQARLIQLAALGLLEPPSRQAVKEDVVAAIRGMGILQIDTINVVARSPYLVLFSRLGDYPPAWLDQSLAEGLVFEHWAHAACFIPIDDFSLNRRFVVDGDRVVNYGSWVDENRAVIDSVLDIVRREGSKRSSDFKSPKESGGWWNRKVEKWALEYWLDHGEVMVAKRENFQRVYDLTDRVLPGWDDSQLPARDNVIRELVIRSVKAMGVARPEWIADYYRLPKRDVARFLPGLLENKDLLELKVKEWDQPALLCRRFCASVRGGNTRHPARHPHHPALAVRPARLGPRAGAPAFRLRFHHPGLHPCGQAALRVLSAPHPAQRRPGWTAGCQGTPQGWGF